jgi:hypothetical protein
MARVSEEHATVVSDSRVTAVFCFLFIVSLSASLWNPPLSAQFFAPIPKAASGRQLQVEEILSGVRETLRDIYSACELGGTQALEAARRICRTGIEKRAAFSAEISRFCQGKYSAQPMVDSCTKLVNQDSILRERLLGLTISTWPIGHGRAGIARLYESAGDFGVLTGFAANLRDDQVFVLTDLVSGALGAFPFAATTALVVTKTDTAIVASGTATPDTINGVRSRLVRLINNGGSISGRILAPIYVYRGPTISFSQSVYAQVGLLGPLSHTDSLQGSGAMVAEAMFSFAVRKPDTSGTQVADLLVGMRLGEVWSESAIAAPVVNKREFGFFQLGVGLRTGEKLGISILLTEPLGSPSARRYVPRLMVNLSAIGF